MSSDPQSLDGPLSRLLDAVCNELEKVQGVDEALGQDVDITRLPLLFKKTMQHIIERLTEIVAQTAAAAGSQSPLIVPWYPTFDDVTPEIKQHIQNLRIPSLYGNPYILLHGLGETPGSDNPQEAARLSRIASVFLKGSVKKHSVLLNTAGAGKTRLVLEGLCANWGIYLTCNNNFTGEIGSSDIFSIIDPTNGYLQGCAAFSTVIDISPSCHDTEERDRKISDNVLCAQTPFRAVLFARLLVLEVFLSIIQKHHILNGPVNVDHMKRAWTLIQADNGLLASDDFEKGGGDVFLQLSRHLCYLRTKFLLNHSKKSLHSCMQAIRNLPGSSDKSIYCVIDEAQFAADTYEAAFVNQDSTKHRPVLRAMLATWISLDLQFIITGTSLNYNIIVDALSSSLGKEAALNTGVTDASPMFDEKKVRTYLREFLSPAYRDSPSGRELIRRVGSWLIGRPRFTAAFIQILLKQGLRSPHRALTDYVYRITFFTPKDGGSFEDEEPALNPMHVSRLCPFDFLRAQNLSTIHPKTNLVRNVQRMVYHRLTSGSVDFLEDRLVVIDTVMVECGFARYPAPDAPPVIDEPLAYLAADHWISTMGENWVQRHQYFIEHIGHNTPTTNGYELYVASRLADDFRNFTPLFKHFDLVTPSEKSTGLYQRNARLVSRWTDALGEHRFAPVCYPLKVEQDSNGRVTSGLSSPAHILCRRSKRPEDVVRWLQGRLDGPILLPDNNFGPDLLMCLQLDSLTEFVWLAVQVKLKYNSVPSDVVQDSIDSVTPRLFWMRNNGTTFAPEKYPHIVQETQSALDHPGRFKNRNGVAAQDMDYFSVIRLVCIAPAHASKVTYLRILEKQPHDRHDVFSLPFEGDNPAFRGYKRPEYPANTGLKVPSPKKPRRKPYDRGIQYATAEDIDKKLILVTKNLTKQQMIEQLHLHRELESKLGILHSEYTSQMPDGRTNPKDVRDRLNGAIVEYWQRRVVMNAPDNPDDGDDSHEEEEEE